MFNTSFDPLGLLSALIVLFTCMPIHECAHAYAAYKLGDDTAYQLGRMDLNPLKHLDPVGSVMLLLSSTFSSFCFGWAKPVPVTPSRFTHKVSLRGGMVIVALAGPLSNILLATIVMIPTRAVLYAYYAGRGASDTLFLLYQLLSMIVSINVSIGIFNLLPVPPLDGYRVVSYFIPARLEEKFLRYQQIIYIAMLILVFNGFFSGILSFVATRVYQLIYFLTGFVDPIMKAILF